MIGIVAVIGISMFILSETNPASKINQETKQATNSAQIQKEPVKSVEPKPEPVKTESVKTEIDCSGSAQCITGTVEKIVDGDTLDINGIRIRIALTNTPEINEAGYSEATEFTKKLCPVGSIAIVDQDDLQLYDKYGRMLGKVTCSGLVLNSELLYKGYANISNQFCTTSEFSGESWAQQYGCATKIESKPQTAKEQTVQSSSQKCDPSYPDFCIPPSPPDLDCKDISQKRFTVLPPDPHRFDGDEDGIGCES
jgi:micrococcal nuclease